MVQYGPKKEHLRDWPFIHIETTSLSYCMNNILKCTFKCVTISVTRILRRSKCLSPIYFQWECLMVIMHVGSQHWTVASLATGAAALVSLLLAIATTHWVYTTESCVIPYIVENITILVNFSSFTNFGILQLCTLTVQSSGNPEDNSK